MTAIVERPNTTSLLRQFLVNARCESKTFWATPGAFIFIVAMPLLAYLIVGFVNKEAGTNVVSFDGFTLEARQRYFAAMLVFATFSASFTSTAIGMGTRRLDGRFRRLRTTAANPIPVMAALLSTWLLIALLVDALISVMAVTLFGVRADLDAVGQLISLTLLGMITYITLGFAVSLFFRSPEAATPLSNLIFFPLIFISGMFYEVDLGEVGNRIVAVLPLKPLMSLLAGTLAAKPAPPDPADILVLCGWLVVSAFVVAWRFRWTSESEPPRSRVFGRARSAGNGGA